MTPDARTARHGAWPRPADLFAAFTRDRFLLAQLVRREIAGRYRGSLFGLLWSLFNPLFMLATYTFVFGLAFRARWSEGGGHAEFATMIFCGMIVHSLFAECINKAPQLILGNPNYVRKVVFPLDILPWVTTCAALFHAAVSLGVLLAFRLLAGDGLAWTALLAPLVLAPFVLLTLGVTWFLAALGVFVRDIAQTTGLAATALLFLSPVFYPAEALPAPWRQFLYLNPLTFIIEQMRAVLLHGRAPAWDGLALYAACGLLAAWLGLAWFQKTRRGFADVL
jgi:lipopolysaccharide transport system permease protein